MRNRSTIAAGVILLFFLAVLAQWILQGNEGETAPEGQLAVHFIDVGQGDAIFIETPRQNILIDGGECGSGVAGYLISRGVRNLDLVIGTHPHSDHIGGLIEVLREIKVKEVIDPGVVHTTKTFEEYLTLIDEQEIKFTEGRAGLSRDLGGGAAMLLLHPASPSSSQLNNASITARVDFGQVSFLLTGDIESAAEREILERGGNPAATVLKVSHHGSKDSTTPEFLDAVRPEVAVIMCGSGNSYGHPHQETLEKLSRAGVEIYRTDRQGTIVVTTDGDGYTVEGGPLSWRRPADTDSAA